MIDARVEQAIRESKTNSLYVYQLSRMDQQLDMLWALPANVKVYYAVKANPNVEIIAHALAHRNIAGAEIASKGEAKRVLASGQADLRRTIYTGPGKAPEELAFTLGQNLACDNLESLVEAYRVNELYTGNTKQKVLVRVNVDNEIHGSATKMSSATEPSPFGIWEQKIAPDLAQIMQLPKLDVQGFHIFSASGVLSADALLGHVEYAMDFASELAVKSGYRFPELDIGGGFGIDYQGDKVFDVAHFASGLHELSKKSPFSNIIIELGRYIVADMGVYATKIIDIKESRGQKLLVCADGTNAHRRPAALKVEYPTEIIRMNEPKIYEGQPCVRDEVVQIRGSQCTDADRLSNGVRIGAADIGDYVVQKKAGAYGLSMSAVEFLSHDRVPEIIIR